MLRQSVSAGSRDLEPRPRSSTSLRIPSGTPALAEAGTPPCDSEHAELCALLGKPQEVAAEAGASSAPRSRMSAADTIKSHSDIYEEQQQVKEKLRQAEAAADYLRGQIEALQYELEKLKD